MAVLGCENQHCFVAYGVKGESAAVEFWHLDEFYAESREDFTCADFITGDTVGDSAAEEN